MFCTSIKSLYSCVKADIKMNILFMKQNILTEQYFGTIVCRRRDFLDKIRYTFQTFTVFRSDVLCKQQIKTQKHYILIEDN